MESSHCDVDDCARRVWRLLRSEIGEDMCQYPSATIAERYKSITEYASTDGSVVAMCSVESFAQHVALQQLQVYF